MSINTVVVSGNLVRDPELKYTPKGTAICNFSIAVNEKWGDKENTIYLECTSWEKSAEFVSKHFHKGKPIMVEGKLAQSTWDDKDSGKKRSKTFVTATRIHFMGDSKQPRQHELKQDREHVGDSDDDMPF